MASKYFSLIRREVDTLSFYAKDDEDRTKLNQYKPDLKILEMLCSCLDYTTDEQRNESMKSTITHLKIIWVEDNVLETWPEAEDIQDFDPMTFGLDEKIEQSKPLIEKCCQILVRSSSSMQMQMKCMSSTSLNIMEDFVISVYNITSYLLSYNSDSEIDPFNNHIDILKNMLGFLFDSLCRVERCTDSNELHEYRNFVLAFSCNAACLICMYWAKEANEIETATEMNIALFDMLHEIKPCAAHVTASYFAVLKSNDLLQSYDSIYKGQDPESFEFEATPASFVDFFFKHTILKDDFLILRERLILLFTFLTDAPHENAQEEEEDLLRRRIHVLLLEDAYLLLPISEMKEDFSNNKMLLSDFMNKIEILNANILHLYYTPSDSLNRLEAGKMSNIYFASLQRELVSFQDNPQVHLYLTEIRFLRSLFFPCFETWDDSDKETRLQLRSVVTSLQRIWGQEYEMGLLSGRLYTIRKEDNIEDRENLLDLELKENFQLSKQEIYAWLVSLSHFSFHCRPSTSSKILKFLDSILYNTSDLVTSRACKDVAFKKQIEIFEEKLLLLQNLSKLAINCTDSKNLDEFNMLAQVFANNAACLIYLDRGNEAKTSLMLSIMLQKIKPNTTDVARTYIGTLKAICLQSYNSILLEQTVMSFVDYFFEDLVTPWKNGFQILRDEVIFLLKIVCHHHTGNAEEIVWSQLGVLFNDGVYDLLPFDDMKGDFSKRNVGLTDFMSNIETENAKIRQLYCQFPKSFLSIFPRMIGQGFLDSLIQKLRHLTERMNSDKNHVPCAKDKIKTIEEELLSLTPKFNQILELKNLNDAWFEVLNAVYLVEHVISLCVIFYHLMRHYIPYLLDVIDRIKAVKTKLEKIEKWNKSNSRCLPHPATLEIHGVLVGFKKDKKIIIDSIMSGTKSLDIVSIVGMGGLGKTTLAQKVYGSSSVKSHFHISAFAYVSQYHDKKRLLLDILKNIVKIDAETSCMTEDELAHKLKKCLSRKRYFIVLDDIWDINAWYGIRSSFPDHENGSRIMFTTRSFKVAKSGQIECPPHPLGFLSEDESWELLQQKVFPNDMPPPNLFSVAKLIAKECHGLPLAIIVIAGLLARTETSLWVDISKRVSSCLFDEGCMDILELSYKHLPEYLKPCLIYLGAFPKDRSYKVKKVTLLWIAEGFIKGSKTRSLNDVAKKYLYELVDRSLVTVDKMTISEICTFRVHDLIHDLCQKKCLDENFFHIGHGTATSSFSASSIYKHYRVSTHKLCDITTNVEPSLANTRSLLYFPSELGVYKRIFPLRVFRFAQVLHLEGIMLQQSDFVDMTSLVDLRHIEVEVSGVKSIPASISNLWNIQSLILTNVSSGVIDLSETLWRMKSLRHVKVHNFKLKDSDGYKFNACPQLDKVVSFSKLLSTGKDVEWLLQRLPAVRNLSCILVNESLDSIDEKVETLDFHRKLESLKLKNVGGNCPYLISFPSTLIKLTLERFKLSSTNISAIVELESLRILKLHFVSFPDTTWVMEDVTFPNLKYFELTSSNLELWYANIDSFPCLEQLFCAFTVLEELPPCFGEISSLKKITITRCSPKLESSVRWVQEEQIDWGNNVELEIEMAFKADL